MQHLEHLRLLAREDERRRQLERILPELRRLLGFSFAPSWIEPLSAVEEILERLTGLGREPDLVFRAAWEERDAAMIARACSRLRLALPDQTVKFYLTRPGIGAVRLPLHAFLSAPLSFAALNEEIAQVTDLAGESGLAVTLRSSTRGHAWRLEVWGASWSESAHRALSPFEW